MTFITEIPPNDSECSIYKYESKENEAVTIDLIRCTSGHYDLTHVSRLDLSRKNLSSMNGLGTKFPLPYLVYLDLSHNSIGILTDLSLLENLEFLNLSYNSIYQHPSIVFNEIKKLEVLQLEGNKIHNINDSIPWLGRCTRLRRLSFQRAQGQDACPICYEPNYIQTMLTVSPKLTLLDEKSVVLLRQSLIYNIKPIEGIFDPEDFILTPFTIDADHEPVNYLFEDDVMKEEKKSLEEALTDAQKMIKYLNEKYCVESDTDSIPLDKWRDNEEVIFAENQAV